MTTRDSRYGDNEGSLYIEPLLIEIVALLRRLLIQGSLRLKRETVLVLFIVIWVGPLDRVKPYWHVFDPPDEVVWQTLHIANHFDHMETLHYLFPEYAQLEFRQAIAHATMHAKTECNMCPRVGSIDDQFIGIFKYRLITVARELPHHNFVTFFDVPSAKLIVL